MLFAKRVNSFQYIFIHFEFNCHFCSFLLYDFEVLFLGNPQKPLKKLLVALKTQFLLINRTIIAKHAARAIIVVIVSNIITIQRECHFSISNVFFRNLL